ncbi:DUF2490 domain-containing protein [Psychroserpens sp. XS_ASV72]|uniref:DUF2490 domain-containing protein n=1 Tax=Psychroserpens sp. XS_ASV72 TaxID=3241293 RepID=UPI003512661D
MNTLCTKRLFVIFFLVLVNLSYSQEDTDIFNENAFSIRHSFDKLYSVNFELSNRAFLYTDNEAGYRMRQLQMSHFSNFKIDLRQSVAFGIMYRNRNAFEDSSNELRLTQQYNRKSILKTLRFGHRFRSEQRFYDHFTAFRFRYRLALDLPLQGLKLDVGETYLVLSNEALWTSTKISKPELDYRLSPALGLLLSEDLNLEFGVELRLDKINIKTEEVLFFNTSVDLNI